LKKLGNNMDTRLEHEFDEDYFLARRLQREEEDFRRQEEEKNQLALKKFLAEEERSERRRRQSQLKGGQMAALTLQKQWIREQREEDYDNIESELVDYKTLLQQQQEEEESLALVMKLQAEEEEQERREREWQRRKDERFAAKMMLMQEETMQKKSVPAVAMAPNSSVQYENNDHRVALKVEKEERMKMIVSQMFQEHAKFERIAKRRSRRMTVEGFETPTSLVFATSS